MPPDRPKDTGLRVSRLSRRSCGGDDWRYRETRPLTGWNAPARENGHRSRVHRSDPIRRGDLRGPDRGVPSADPITIETRRVCRVFTRVT